MTLTTKAEFLRNVPVGTKLVLVNSLMGPTCQKRTVTKVSGMRLELLTQKGTTSHLRLTPNEQVYKTQNGYRIVLKDDHPERICAEYEYDSGQYDRA